MASYFGSYIAVGSFKILQVILYIQLVQNFNLRCPVQSEWDVVARGRCNATDDYVCLFDENLFIYGHTCSPRPHFEPPGYKSILLGGITRKECSSRHYQPFIFWTNGSSDCTYQKSLCTEKGQVLYGNGTTKTDRSCHCDYTKNYAFTREPRNKCFCVPSEEDCSCSIKDCPIGHLLTPDYECVSVTNWKPSFRCKEIDELKDKHSSVIYKENSTTEGYSNISEAHGVGKTEVTVIIILSLLVLLLFLLVMLFAPKLLSRIIVELQNLPGSFFAKANVDEENVHHEDEESASMMKNENVNNAISEVISPNSTDEQNIEWERLTENHKHFVVTPAAKRVLIELKEKAFIIIIGPPGSGKSATMCYASEQLKTDQNYKIISVSNPIDIRKHISKDCNRLFVFDNAFGMYVLDERKIDRWRQEEVNIKNILLENHNIKIMLTCRSYIHQRSDFHWLALSPVVLDLLSNKLRLSSIYREEIYTSYLEHSTFQDLSEEVIDMFNFFPLICSAFAEIKKGKKLNAKFFFTNPYTLLKPELDILKEKSDVAYLVIGVLVVLNNVLKTRMLDLNNEELKAIMDDLFQESGLKNQPSKALFRSSATALVGTYLKETAKGFEFLNQKLFENVAFCIGNNFIHSILKHGDSIFIKDRLRFESLDDVQTELPIILQPQLENLFFERLFKDIKEGKNWTVFGNPQMQSSLYRRKFKGYLCKLEKQHLIIDYDGSTALHVVAENGTEEFVQFLTKINVEQVFSTSHNGRTPLHNACARGKPNLSSLICRADFGNDASRPSYLDNSATQNENSTLGTHFTEYRNENQTWSTMNDVHTKTSFDNEENYLSIIKFLLKNKASVNHKDANGLTPLHIACLSNSLVIVELLVTVKNLNHKPDKRGFTPLHIACEMNSEKILKVLVKHGADTNIKTKCGEYPLHISAKKGFAGITSCLLRNNAIANALDDNKSTPLHLACRERKSDVVKVLLENNAKVDLKNEEKDTALHIACRKNDTDIAELLITKGAKVNAANKHGIVPLHISCGEGREALTQVLLKNSAKKYKVDKDGHTPFDKANTKHHTKIVRILNSKDA